MIIDAHLDLAFNAVGLGGDIRLPLDQLRTTTYGRAGSAQLATPTVSLPALRDGGVRVVFGTIFVLKPTSIFKVNGPTYTSVAEANTQGWAQLHYYQQLAEHGEITLIGDQATLEQALAGDGSQPGLVPLMEGADPIRDIDELAVWYNAGIRIIGPAWSGTRYCGGTGEPGPLTADGQALVQAMNDHLFALDMSHFAEDSFWQALDLFNGPILASHANCRAFVPTDRQLSDDMIKAIVDRDGVIGVVPFSKFLHNDWMPPDPRVSITEVIRHIEHICELAGDTHHVGIGSDFDGGFGVEALPTGVNSIKDLPRIGDALTEQGWSKQEVAGVLGENWARWLRGVLR